MPDWSQWRAPATSKLLADWSVHLGLILQVMCHMQAGPEEGLANRGHLQGTCEKIKAKTKARTSKFL